MRLSPRGFTLVEVMMAMGIFAIGTIAILALFPAASLIQRRTVDDVLGQIVAANAQQIIKARGWSASDLNAHPDFTGGNLDLHVHALPPQWIDSDLSNDFTPGGLTNGSDLVIADRTYPSTITTVANREWGWVPLIKRTRTDATTKDDWQVFVFTMRRPAGAPTDPTLPTGGTYANPASAETVWRVEQINVTRMAGALSTFQLSGSDADKLHVGDKVLDEFGTIYKIVNKNGDTIDVNGLILEQKTTTTGTAVSYPTYLWIVPAPTANDPSPIVDCLIIVDAIND